MNYVKYIECDKLTEKESVNEETEVSKKELDLGLEIDLAHNAKVQELLNSGKDPSILPDKVYCENHPVKAFCFTGNGLYFSGSMCWSEYLKEWGVCHLSYPGWIDNDFIGEGVKTALEGINKFIKEHPELANQEHICFYGNISEDGKFSL